MIVEVAGNERDIQVAGLANRFPIVQRFQDGQETRVFLDVTSNSVEIASTHMSWRLAPTFKCCARRGYGDIYIGTIGSSNLCQRFTGRGIDAVKILTTGRLDPLVIDEQTKGLSLLDPLQCRRFCFLCRPVLHSFIYLHKYKNVPPAIV